MLNLIAVAFAVLLSSTTANDNAENTMPTPPIEVSGRQLDIHAVLDDTFPADLRRQNTAALIQSANEGNIDAACLAGRLGMLNEESRQLGLAQTKLPRSISRYISYPVHTDYGDVRQHLQRCAHGGDIIAFLSLALYELRANDPRSALQWLLIHNAVSSIACAASTERYREIASSMAEKAFKSDTALTDEIGRVEGSARAYVQTHGATIISAFRSHGPFTPHRLGLVISTPNSAEAAQKISQRRLKRGLNFSEMVAHVVILRNASGATEKIIPLDAWPSLQIASGYMELLLGNPTGSAPDNSDSFLWIGGGPDFSTGGKAWVIHQPLCHPN